MHEEILLEGGNVNQVARIGETVHRTTQWHSKVHHLLRHLEKKGFEGAPGFLGIDAKGREILSYIPGDVAGNAYPNCKPYVWSMETLKKTAVLLRKYHDATEDFMPEAKKLGWINPYINENYEVVCHNDAAPYNIVFNDAEPKAFIDFDMASPGPRI